jgi:hypothetical protein
MNKYHSLLLATALLVGSTQLSGAETYPVYVPTTKSVITSNDIIKIENGQLQFHGKTILDEDGNIGMAFNINNKLFYFTTKELDDSAIYILKDESGKEIRKFEGAMIQLLSSSDGLPLILVQLREENNKYDNVYKFDGQEVKLISKNLQRYENEFYGAGYQIIPLGGAGFVEYAPIKSVLTGETKTLGTLHPIVNLFGSSNPKRMQIITTSGANIIYQYNASDGTNALEVYNTNTDERKTIASGDSTLQIWYSGDKKILRIFQDKSLEEETAGNGAIPVSNYDDKESTFLDLASLDEVKVNPKDFKKFVLTSNFYGAVVQRISFKIKSMSYTSDKHEDRRPLL